VGAAAGVGNIELPDKFQGHGFCVQVAYVSDANGAVVRLRALSKSPPPPSPDHLSVAFGLQSPLTVIRYADVPLLAQFFSSVCSMYAGDTVVLFTDVVRCLFPRAIHLSALTSDPLVLARRVTPLVVGFDSICFQEVFERFKVAFPRPPRIILAAPLGTGSVELPTWIQQSIESGKAAVVRLTSSTCAVEVLPHVLPTQADIPEEQRWT